MRARLSARINGWCLAPLCTFGIIKCHRLPARPQAPLPQQAQSHLPCMKRAHDGPMVQGGAANFVQFRMRAVARMCAWLARMLIADHRMCARGARTGDRGRRAPPWRATPTYKYNGPPRRTEWCCYSSIYRLATLQPPACGPQRGSRSWRYALS